MYRIHFNACGALGTESAVLEIGPADLRWRICHGEINVASASLLTEAQEQRSGSRRRVAPEQRVVMRDFAARWPAYERRRRIRRWKAEFAADTQLILCDVREQLDAMTRSLFPPKAMPLPLELVGPASSEEINPVLTATPGPTLEVA